MQDVKRGGIIKRHVNKDEIRDRCMCIKVCEKGAKKSGDIDWCDWFQN